MRNKPPTLKTPTQLPITDKENLANSPEEIV